MQELRIEGVSKRYHHVAALSATTLTVAAGEFLTLLGPSGSGKTTLLSLIAGLIESDTGQIFLDGQDISGLPPYRRGLGMVFQNYALFPHMTVTENVAFGLQARRLPVAEVQQKTQYALDMVRLGSFAHRLPKELSGGQQQRVALARALAYQPAIVLMDEPLGALDRNLREEMKLEIARLHRELGTSVIYVTHDQEEALVLSDRICLMNQARVEQIDTPQTLYFKPQTRFAAEFLGESNLFPCQVQMTDVGDRQANVVTVEALGIRMPYPESAPDSENTMLMLRPESIDVGTASAKLSAGLLAVEAQVQSSQFLGAMTRLMVRVGETDIRVLQRTTSLSDLQRYSPGARVMLWMDPTRCHLVKA